MNLTAWTGYRLLHQSESSELRIKEFPVSVMKMSIDSKGVLESVEPHLQDAIDKWLGKLAGKLLTQDAL
jgi:hypothetical protein